MMLHRRSTNCARGRFVVVPAALLAGVGTTFAGSVSVQPRAGDPLPGLTAQQIADFELGQTRYNTSLEVEDGLGPIFNKESCGNCHNNPLGGFGSQTVTRFGFTTKGGFDPLAHLGGSLLQAESISEECAETVPDGAFTSFRITNGIMGYGLVEAILDADIEAVQAGQSAGVQGTVHYVTAFEDPIMEPPITHVGRFGHKAQVATVLTFSADAGQNELGLSNRFIPFDNDPNGEDPPALIDCDDVPDPEDSIALGNGVDKEFIDVITDFQRFMAGPPQMPRSGMTGETIFNNIGCVECHHPGYTTPDVPELEDVLRDVTIRPYTDFLLHNMGQASDFIDQGGVAGIGMIKTAPLWGLVHRDPLWHDARIGGGSFEDRMIQAIGLHDSPGSQAEASGEAFDQLLDEEKDALIAFLASLGRIEFDADNDGDVQFDDFAGTLNPFAFENCIGSGVTPDDPCAVHDIDQDGDVDADDYAHFETVYEGPFVDCNNNGTLDISDIGTGLATDANVNGIPDECDCMADTDGSGVIDVDDIIGVILNWGTCPGGPGCPGDTNMDGEVAVDDLINVILAFGLACP